MDVSLKFTIQLACVKPNRKKKGLICQFNLVVTAAGSEIVLVALITLARLWETQQYELRNIQILLTPLNLQNTCGNTHHILSPGVFSPQYRQRRIIEGLMIQQFCPILNKQVISYASKLFPTGIT